eukprot:s2532_g18.t1
MGYVGWRDDRGLSWDGPLAPLEAPPRFRLRQRHAEGQQAGALSHKAALPPLLSFGLAMDEHFHQAEGLLQCPTPLEMPPLVDEDLRYAASCSSKDTQQLVKFRKFAVGFLIELKQRWQGVTLHLRQFQPGLSRWLQPTEI